MSQALGRGRHTTRHVELFHLSCGADVVDSPGFSSFETDELNLELKHRLPETFVEFRPYLDQCRFVGCSHTKEKGRCPPLFVCPAFCTRTGSGVYNGSEKGAWGVCFGEAADAGYWASVRWRWGPGS